VGGWVYLNVLMVLYDKLYGFLRFVFPQKNMGERDSVVKITGSVKVLITYVYFLFVVSHVQANRTSTYLIFKIEDIFVLLVGVLEND